MNELQIINVNEDTQTVSARELHKIVGSTERFSNWFDRQLQFGFIENEDYVGCKTFNTQAHQELTDYNISVDMAKHICMVQRTDKAREVRQYLIDLEKAWNTPEQILARALKVADQTITKLHQRIARQDEQLLIQDSVISEMQPKVNYVDTILNSPSTTLVTQIAQDYGMSARGFNKMLHDMGLQYKVSGQWILYSKYQGNGYVHSRTFDYEKANGTRDVNMNTAWTQKGRLFLYEFLKERNVLPLIEKC